jgi:peptidoglycan hydrolase-like protein with peptidoglycan-binding domain
VPKLSSANVLAYQAEKLNRIYEPTRRAVQTRLKELGYYQGTIDGKFGSLTFSAIIAFVRDAKLKPIPLNNFLVSSAR